MNKFLVRSVFFLFALAASFASTKVSATHLYGGDLAYTYVSGNTYRITLTLYGNCAGASFPTLQGSTAQVDVYNGSTFITSLVLTQSAANPPIEVTPVCAGQSTPCTSPVSTNPGVKRFIYTTNYSVTSLSANWRFRFNGSAGGSAGRSNNISNIVSGTNMSIEATLNNTIGPNSSPVYTTIPTPFFCVNKPAGYNPGAVDADGDVLTFSLVPGLLPTTGTVTYTGPYTPLNPLASTPGTFTFSNTNGQLDFTPNATQFSLVVSQVSEYRGSVLVGTSMREMTFVVLPCFNNPPGGSVSSPSTGVNIISGTNVTVCRERGLFNFSINPTDIDGDTIDVTAYGLPAGATFAITNNGTIAPQGLFTWDVSAVAPGTYSFFVTYIDHGCPLASKQTVAYTITVLPNPALTYSLITPATCLTKAVFTLTPTAATTGPFVVGYGTTTRNNVTGTITDSLSPGTYTFSITAPNGCDHDTSITIASPATGNVNAVIANNTCNATSNGAVTLTGFNSFPPYTYALGAGAFSPVNVFAGLATGTYTFHVKDQLGCIKDTVLAVKDSLVVHGAITVTNVLCNGGNNGALQVTANGGVSPYRYALGTGTFGSSGTFSTNTAGTYAVHILDTLGCYNDTLAAITQPTPLGATAVTTNVTCNGLTNGAVTVTASGGTTPYLFSVGSGAYTSANTFGSLGAGTYVFHLKDGNGCVKDTTIAITQPAVLSFSFAVANVLCNGNSNGSVTVNATGGTTAYTYAADAGVFGASNVLSGLNAGSHMIHLKDANGCTKDSVALITEPAVLGIAFTATDPICNGEANGTITITGTGGTAAYSFALDANPFVSSGAMTGLAAGTYAVHLKDANGCAHDTTATLVNPPVLTVTASVARPRCTPLVNGVVTLAAAGGVPGYTFARGTGAFVASPTFTGLGSGTYIFHVKDSRSCVKDTTIVLTDSVFIHASTTITDAKCFGGADGSIAIVPSGGDAPYTFAVNATPFAATTPIINLAAATYVLHVKDANGCVLDTNQVVGQPSIIVPAVVITQPLCFQGSDGIIAISATGGTPGYTFASGAGAFGPTATFAGLAAGSYPLHVKDANGCPHDTTVTMGQPTKLVFGFTTMTHLICFNDSSGTITVRASGATPPYTYAADANPFQPNNVLTGLKAGVRPFHVKDANGCTIDSSVLLFEPTKVHVRIDTVITPTCETYKDGSVKMGAYGGTPGYTYSATNTSFDTQRFYWRLPEGNYAFYTKDSRGCVADTTVSLIGYPHISINRATVTDVSCNGLSDGKFELLVTGGNPKLNYYLKSPADTNLTGSFDSLKKGNYAIKIVDSTGCFKDTLVKIGQPDILLARAIVTNNDCIGYDNAGMLEAVATGGTAPYSYLWSTAPAQTSAIINGLANGKYSVLVTDAHQCTDTALATVGYDNCCKPYIVNAFTPNGDGKNDKFRVLFKGDVKLENFSVFNRYGQRIFYTTLTDVGWDGTWNDQPQDMGTYFYYIRLICGNKGDNIIEYKGDVTLVR